MGKRTENGAEREYYATLYANYLTYHNHKENLAHAAMAAQVAFIMAVVTWDGWPPGCAALHPWCWRVGVWFIWLVLYLYAGWEMRLRRYAAAVCRVSERELGRVACGGKRDGGNRECQNKCQLIECWAQYVLWFPWGFFLKAVVENRGYPQHIQEEIQDQLKARDKYLVLMETCTFVFSVVIFLVLCVTAFERCC